MSHSKLDTPLDNQQGPQSGRSLQIWAVDVSEWPATQSSKGALQPLLNEFFEPHEGQAASSSSSQKEKDIHQRVLRYVREIDRTRSLAALLLPRIAIVQLLNDASLTSQTSTALAPTTWHDLCFDRTREGRPFLTHPTLRLDFNISHDGDWVVMALYIDPSSSISTATQSNSSSEPITPPAASPSPHTRVGIDVMSLHLPHFESSPSSFLDTMQDSVTSAEEEWVRSALHAGQSEEGLERLWDLWTHKEALTKNLGLGLGFDFKRVELALWECKPQDRRERRGKCEEVLRMDGRKADQYVFTEVSLPAGKGNGSSEQRRRGSKLVVCEGPFAAPQGERDQIAPSIAHKQAEEEGWLKIWTMQELVDEAKRLATAR